MEYNEKRHLRTKRIAGFKRFEADPLLLKALIVSMTGTLLLIAGGLLPVGTPYFIYVSRSLFLAAHLLLAVGSSLLLWAVVSFPDEMTGERDMLLCSVVFLNAAYHLSAAVGSALAYQYGLYHVTLVLWWLRSIAGIFVALDFLINGDRRLQLAGVLLVLTYVTGCPYQLSGILGLAQWGIAKVVAISLYVQLYRCAVRIYNPAKAEKDPLDTPCKRQ